MHKEILINAETQETRVVVLENGALEEFFVERPLERPMAGNIYKGKILSIIPGIQAAFVDIGLERNGFLFVSDIIGPVSEFEDLFMEEAEELAPKRPAGADIQNLVKKGQEVLVQIIKEPIGTKGPRLSTHISLPGRYIVHLPMERHIGISRKISDPAERQRLREIIAGIFGRAKGGAILRTVCDGKSKRDIYRDFKYLSWLWRKIKIKASRAAVPALVHEEYDLLLRIMRDYLSEDITRVVIDDRAAYKRVMKFLAVTSPHLRPRIFLYGEDVPLFEKHGIESHIAKIYDRKIQLKSGSYIVIEPTESLVAIDVNTGKFVGRKSHEDTIYQTNLEAAREIARQVRLRDLGGIVVIDFIDMESQQNRKSVLAALDDAMHRDKAKYNIVGLSEIGLVEMTRQRIRKGLESVVYRDCPYCGGRGKVASALSVSIKVHKLLEAHLKKTRTAEVSLFLHPDVAKRLIGEDSAMVAELQRRFRTKITVTPDAGIHLEDIRIS